MAVIVRLLGRLVDGAPDGDGADDDEGQERQAAEADPDVEPLDEHPVEQARAPERDGDAGERATDADGEQLVEVVGRPAVFGLMHVGHSDAFSGSPGERGVSTPWMIFYRGLTPPARLVLTTLQRGQAFIDSPPGVATKGRRWRKP